MSRHPLEQARRIAYGVKVNVGDRVVRGQSVGTLGNSGNTSAPHLHFHVMDGPSVLGSNGLPLDSAVGDFPG